MRSPKNSATHFQCSRRRCKKLLENADGNCFECTDCGRIFCLACVLQNEDKLRRYGIGAEFGYEPLHNEANNAPKVNIVNNPMMSYAPQGKQQAKQNMPQNFLQPAQAAQIAPQLRYQQNVLWAKVDSLHVWRNLYGGVAGATASMAENARHFVRRLSNISNNQ